MTVREMLSVGVDVGTTTTQVVLSELTVANRARSGLVPRLDIDARKVRYQSQPHFTPLLSADEVDVDRLVALVRAEYDRAGITPQQVETGAVIITGETARTRNAEAILAGLGELAGDFVVTVAGPNVESQIAGRGSGAAQWSIDHYASVVNVDIGGGSANAALFRGGTHLSSSASMVGGRQVILDPVTAKVIHLAPTGRALNEKLGLGIQLGQVAELAALRRLADVMAEIVYELCLGKVGALGELAQLSPPLEVEGSVAAYFISGGVGALYYANAACSTLAEVAAWGDVGPLLADSLRRHQGMAKLNIVEPQQTLRATVMGAASQQVTLSGSTIWAEDHHLPIRNAPVVEPHIETASPDYSDAKAMQQALGSAVQRWDRGATAEGDVAIALTLPKRLHYPQLIALSDALAAFGASNLPPGRPLVLVTEADYAQALGQTIKQRQPGMGLIVIDQVCLAEGDFIDIGEPLFDGRVVPVSVKTLIFYQPAES